MWHARNAIPFISQRRTNLCWRKLSQSYVTAVTAISGRSSRCHLSIVLTKALWRAVTAIIRMAPSLRPGAWQLVLRLWTKRLQTKKLVLNAIPISAGLLRLNIHQCAWKGVKCAISHTARRIHGFCADQLCLRFASNATTALAISGALEPGSRGFHKRIIWRIRGIRTARTATCACTDPIQILCF
jgi:hypothetical protein